MTRRESTYEQRLGWLNAKEVEPIVRTADGRAWGTVSTPDGPKIAMFPDGPLGDPLPDDAVDVVKLA